MTVLTTAATSAGSFLRSVDRVWLTLGLLFAGLALAVPAQAGDSLVFTLDAFLRLLPFLALSVILAAWLKAAGADSLVAGMVDRAPLSALVIAAAAGALSPFCSCGVVPLMAALLAAGVPLAPVLAFCVASPLMDPEQFVLMAATLGLPFTLAKTLAAIGLGLLAGGATLALQRAGWFGQPLRAGVGGCGGCRPKVEAVPLRWAFWHEAERRQAFAGEARSTAFFLSKWLLLAFAIESLMSAWLPAEVVAGALGGESWQAIPLAVAVGVPAYLNGFAAIPLVGELMDLGMAPGAALAFLIAGGVTSLPAAMAVHALVRRSVFFWYLAVALTGSLLAGFTLQAVLALAG
ncbi:permease [Pelagibius marinus]|uniref:permease n=1 Tax=Pelagibius marinus TaxID=2762760 RepID=UPI001D04C224|nr:permease [Pelagibius marinus]